MHLKNTIEGPRSDFFEPRWLDRAVDEEVGVLESVVRKRVKGLRLNHSDEEVKAILQYTFNHLFKQFTKHYREV